MMYWRTIITILAATLLSFVAAQTSTEPITGLLGNATVIENNPPGVIYTVALPTKSFFYPEDPRGNIKGIVSAMANPNGIGVSFQVTFSNLPTSGGPFLYHLHTAPVPSDGNCTGTSGHIDPSERGETPACDPTLPQTCQVGDLSGKHGAITSDPFLASYTDDFASTVEGLGSFFGNRSLTLHFANKTRITCANFTLEGSSVGGSEGGSNSSVAANATATKSGGPIQYTGLGASSRSVVPSTFLLAIGALGLWF